MIVKYMKTYAINLKISIKSYEFTQGIPSIKDSHKCDMNAKIKISIKKNQLINHMIIVYEII